MKFLAALLPTVVLWVASAAVAPAQDGAPAASSTPAGPEKVTKLDGTSLFGLVTLTDDYALKISNDSGIFRIPLALLGQKDFQKYALTKDRSKDGRLWAERQDALEEEKEKSSQPDKAAVFEVQLGEIAVFQPVISAYEATLASKTKAEPQSEAKTSEKPDTSGVRLFSGPGGAGGVPFNGPGSSFVQPVLSTGAAAVQSATSLGAPVPTAP